MPVLLPGLRLARTPVIIATQMLESMVSAPRPTRAEVSDVANAILDGTDAVMLSAESATGAYPVEAIRVLDRIIRRTEAAFPPATMDRPRRGEVSFPQAISDAAAFCAQELKARAIVAFTQSGSTARLVSRDRDGECDRDEPAGRPLAPLQRHPHHRRRRPDVGAGDGEPAATAPRRRVPRPISRGPAGAGNHDPGPTVYVAFAQTSLVRFEGGIGVNPSSRPATRTLNVLGTDGTTVIGTVTVVEGVVNVVRGVQPGGQPWVIESLSADVKLEGLAPDARARRAPIATASAVHTPPVPPLRPRHRTWNQVCTPITTMLVKRVAPRSSDLVDVLDRVLDKGIVIDVWLGISVLGIPVVGVDARAVVASIFTYAAKGDAVRGVSFGRRAHPDRVPGSAERGARRRRPAPGRGRRHASPLRCQNGCTFLRRRAPVPPMTRSVIPCPYRPHVVCVLTRV